MTQVGEGQEAAAEVAGPVMTFGAPTTGEILAERYRLEEHINNDSAGRQVWRGIDVVLRRPVAVVLRHPGGDSATEMLQAAVTASRVVHPNLVGVYDAIDEQERAYVVREWVDGEALRELVSREGPVSPQRATAVARALTDALAAVHATGMVHGNVHPGTALIADDGRVVLADARADATDSQESDVRAIGGVLYYALTGHWPHAEAGRSALPDAVRDGSGTIAAPRQVRAGIPAYLDDLTMDLLDQRLPTPEADVLAAELARLDSADDGYAEDTAGPLRFTRSDSADSQLATRKIVVGIAALLIIAVIGLIFGINAITDTGRRNEASTNPTVQAGANAGGSTDGPGEPTPAEPSKIPVNADQVRIVDPPPGSRTDLPEARFVVDDDKDSGWSTQGYTRSDFGNLKEGMGLLIDLREPRSVSEVRMELSAPGAVIEMRTGVEDPGNTSAGDAQIVKTFTRVGEARRTDGVREPFAGFDPDARYRYLLVWITELPQAEDGKYRITLQDVEVYGN